MGQAVEITRTEHSASALRAMAAKTKDAAVARRLLALALVLEGASRRGDSQRHDPTDLARLGSSVPRGRCGWPAFRCWRWTRAVAERAGDGGTEGHCDQGARSGTASGRALAPDRPVRGGRPALVGAGVRANRWQMAA